MVRSRYLSESAHTINLLCATGAALRPTLPGPCTATALLDIHNISILNAQFLTSTTELLVHVWIFFCRVNVSRLTLSKIVFRRHLAS